MFALLVGYEIAVDLTPGRHRVFIEPLPLRLQADSVRVGGQGPATVLGVDVVRRTNARIRIADRSNNQLRCFRPLEFRQCTAACPPGLREPLFHHEGRQTK